MDLIDLLNSDAAELPFTGEADLEDQLKKRFDEYLDKLAKLSSIDPLLDLSTSDIDNVRNLAGSVIEALGKWLDAEPENALQALSQGLSPVEPQIELLSSADVGDIGPMFRVRVAELGARFTAPKMFHIPFDMRDRVATQRYSFPGLPCLYLGRSICACWEEMGRPDLHSLWVSKFEIAPGETVRVLDFAHRPAFVAAGLDYTQRGGKDGYPYPRGAAYAILWPLIAACSVKRPPTSNRSFVVEYVIPQLLLRWLVRRMRSAPDNNTIDGIRYFSTHIDDHAVGLAGTNYVFPSQERQKSGHCPVLCSKFLLTPPVNWQIATSGQFPPPHAHFNNIRFSMTPGWIEDYKFTQFGRVESFVNQINPEKI